MEQPVDPVVEAAMRAVPRAAFLPRRERRRAAYDGPLPLGGGATCSQPRTVAAMLTLLAVRPGDRVLDVGAGSGWTTALLAHLTGPGGSVLGTEVLPDLAAWGEENLRRSGRTWAQIRTADPAVLGDPAGAPYDRILVSAAATGLPEGLVAQLADGGVLVVPVAGTMTRIVRLGDELVTSTHGAYRFVPLVGG